MSTDTVFLLHTRNPYVYILTYKVHVHVCTCAQCTYMRIIILYDVNTCTCTCTYMHVCRCWCHHLCLCLCVCVWVCVCTDDNRLLLFCSDSFPRVSAMLKLWPLSEWERRGVSGYCGGATTSGGVWLKSDTPISSENLNLLRWVCVCVCAKQTDSCTLSAKGALMLAGHMVSIVQCG